MLTTTFNPRSVRKSKLQPILSLGTLVVKAGRPIKEKRTYEQAALSIWTQGPNSQNALTLELFVTSNPSNLDS